MTAWSEAAGEFRIDGEVTDTAKSFTTTIPLSVLTDAGIGQSFKWNGYVFFDMTLGPDTARGADAAQ